MDKNNTNNMIINVIIYHMRSVNYVEVEDQ